MAPVRAVRATLCAGCATLLGIGLARFAYTPLIPALVTEHWLTPGEAATLGAVNLGGYLAGALLGLFLPSRWPAAAMLRAMMVLATATFFACAVPVSFGWFFLWRFAAGLAGGTLMVIGPPAVLPHVPPSWRGLAGGAVFTGVGLGIAASGTIVPLLMRWGLTETWCGLGVVGAGLTLTAWNGWPAPGPTATPRARDAGRFRQPAALKSLYVEYGLNAAGLVPHMVFLVDFIARGLGKGLNAGAAYWVVLGAGAAVGPVAFGRIADRIGFATSIRLAYLAQAALIAVLAVANAPIVLVLSSFIIGAFIPGITTLVSGRVRELAPSDAQTAAWGVATIAFSLGQAIGAACLSYLFAKSGDYSLLFAVGAAALAASIALSLLPSSRAAAV